MFYNEICKKLLENALGPKDDAYETHVHVYGKKVDPLM
jgi:hypothetical protein